MPKEKNKDTQEKKSPPKDTLEERIARGIREGRLRPPKTEFNMEEWRKLPKPDLELAQFLVDAVTRNRREER